MATVRDIFYSPICDKDPRAYLAYVFAVSNNGQRNVGIAAVDGESGKSGCHSSGNDNSGSAFGTAASVRQVAQANAVVDLVARGDVDGVVDIVNSGAKAELSSWYAAAGFSVNSFSDSFGGIRGTKFNDSRGLWWRFDDANVPNESVEVTECGADSEKTVDMVRVECGNGVKEEAKEIVVLESTLANRAKRAQRKARKLRKQALQSGSSDEDVPEWRRKNKNTENKKQEYRGAFGDCSDDVRKKLADTRAERLIAENLAASVKAKSMVENWEVVQKLQEERNKLKALQVSQTIELVRSQDVDKLKKRQEVQVMRDTEVSKVQVERAFGTLANSGNVPAAVGGSAQTIVSGTISPNSSVSEQEVRAMQKKCLDQEKQIVELVARLREAKVDEIRNGTYSVGITVDSDGEPIGDLGDAYCGYIGKDGRFHQGENYDLW